MTEHGSTAETTAFTLVPGLQCRTKVTTSMKQATTGETTPAAELLIWQVVRAVLGETLRSTNTGMKIGVTSVYPVDVEFTLRPIMVASRTNTSSSGRALRLEVPSVLVLPIVRTRLRPA